MSICDTMSSLAFSLSYLSRSQTACNMQGFFIHFGISATPFYNLSLSVFYVLTVCYEKKELWVRNRIEPFLHGVPTLWSLGASIYLLATNHFNENGANCWIADKPQNCSIVGECERGGNAIKYRWIFSVGQTLTIFVLIVTSMMMLVYRVERQEQIMKERFSVRNTSSSLRHRKSSTSGGSKNEVIKQALIYVAAYFLPFFFPVLFFLQSFISGKFNFTIMVLVSIFMPLQGVLNCMVFVRPKIIKLRKSDPNLNIFRAFIKIMTDKWKHFRDIPISREPRVQFRSDFVGGGHIIKTLEPEENHQETTVP